MSRLKKILPLFVITLFLLIIFFYYKNNKSDFFTIQQLDLTLVLQIIFLCFTYLITEALILKNIVKFLDKNINLFQSFLVMSATYFCNTFIQFSGLGYRVYYLNKFKNLKISEIIRYSIDTIICELFIFSLIGLCSILFIDIYSEEIKINIIIYFFFGFFFLISLVYLNFLFSLVSITQNILNKFNLFLFDKIFQFFLMKKKNCLFFYKKQFFVFVIQYIILTFIFLLILKKLDIENYVYLSTLMTTLLDFSFLISLTPYSVGISEFITYAGTRDIPLSLAEIIISVNIFRICMLLIYFICGPMFILINLTKKKHGM